MIDLHRLQKAYEKARADLLAERTHDGHWVGELSTSALSTATAISALAIAARTASSQAAKPQEDEPMIQGGLAWLLAHQNPDGGWGDTDKSHSNIATTMLVAAAIHLAGRASEWTAVLERSRDYLVSHGELDGLRRRYGKDKTFAVPILTNCVWRGWSTGPKSLRCPSSWPVCRTDFIVGRGCRSSATPCPLWWRLARHVSSIGRLVCRGRATYGGSRWNRAYGCFNACSRKVAGIWKRYR